jgi:cobalt-zinc-cadmium efflux system outer membrane protein
LVRERSGVDLVWSDGPSLLSLAAPLTLSQATRFALERHPEIRIEIARVSEARADLVQAGLLPNPVLQGALGYPIDGDGGTPGMASIVQSLASLWERPARVEAAEADLRERVLVLSDVALRLVETVRIRFAEVIFGERRTEIDRKLVELEQQQLNQAIESRKVGEADRRWTNTRRLAWGRAQDRLTQSLAQLAAARRQLAESIGLVAEDGMPSLDPELPDVHSRIGMGRVLELVTEQRLDVAAARVAFQGSGSRERLAQWQQIPEVGVGLGFERNFSGREGLFPRAQLSVPIFDTGRAAIAKARAIEERTKHQAEAVLWAAWLEARLASIEWGFTIDRLERFDEDWLPTARENVALVREHHGVGELALSEVLQEETRLAGVEREYNEVLLTAHRAYFELERSVGGRLSP